jgi:hypothetical protein
MRGWERLKAQGTRPAVDPGLGRGLAELRDEDARISNHRAIIAQLRLWRTLGSRPTVNRVTWS